MGMPEMGTIVVYRHRLGASEIDQTKRRRERERKAVASPPAIVSPAHHIFITMGRCMGVLTSADARMSRRLRRLPPP